MGRTRQPSRLAALAALMLGAWLLLLQIMPAGFAVCLEADGQMRLELVGQECCALPAGAGAEGVTATTSGPCTACQDLALPHQPTGSKRVPLAFPPRVDRAPIVVAVISWPAPTLRALAAWSAGGAQTPQLARLATTVIRC